MLKFEEELVETKWRTDDKATKGTRHKHRRGLV